MLDNIHRTSYKVRISDADKNGTLKCNGLLQMLQEAATEHATILGVDFKALKPLNLGWAVSKFVINITRLPQWGERINVTTWASDKDKVATYREFVVTDSSGIELVSARSQWVLFDTRERKIARMGKIQDWSRLEKKYANTSEFLPLKPPENVVSSAVCAARNDDIDLNGHVNNAVYLIWVIESLPYNFKGLPNQIRINFLEEVMPHTDVEVICALDGENSYHALTNRNTNRECARVNILWKQAQTPVLS